MAERNPNELHVPTPSRLGPYSLVTEFDRGPLGARWLGFVAEGPERGRLVAARRIKTGPDMAAATKLDEAARLAQTIRHAKVAAVLDVVKNPGEVAVVSEHMDGEPLSSLLSLAALGSAPIAPAVALAIVRDVVDASIAMHDAWQRKARGRSELPRRSCHGGLQPDAVLVVSFGEAMLTEPGVAAAAATLPRFTQQAAALPYRAPEQLTPEAPVDERTDVFSAAVILWELLAGAPLFGPKDRLRRPTAAGKVAELKQQLREMPILSLDTVQRPGAAIAPEVAVLVARALQRDPANRYASLVELRQAIGDLPAGRVATEEQVAATVDRLARSRIEARRAAFEQAVGGRVMDSAPPSSMTTDKPSPPSRPVAVVIPGDEWKGDNLAALAAFPAAEAPTKTRTRTLGADSVPPRDEDRPTAPPVADAQTKAKRPPPPTRREPPAPKVAVPPDVPPPPPFVAPVAVPPGPTAAAPRAPDGNAVAVAPAQASEPAAMVGSPGSEPRGAAAISDAGIALATSPAKPAGKQPARVGKTLVWVGLGLAVLAALVAVMVSLSGTGTEASSADAEEPTAAEPTVAAPTGTSTPAVEASSDDVPLAATAEPEDELVDESVDEQLLEPPPTKPGSGESVSKQDRPSAPPVSPGSKGKAFRPSGI